MASREALARVRRVEAQVIDGLVAAVLAAGAYAQIAAGAHHGPVVFASGLVTTSTVAWRRRAPIGAAAAAAAAFAVFAVAVGVSFSGAVLAGLALVFFTLGQRAAATRRDLYLAAALFAASVVVSIVGRAQLSVLDDASGWALFVGAPTIIGYALARRAAIVARLAVVTRQLHDDNEASAERAAAEERLRVARELHDIVAHRVSVMVIQATAARRVEADPDLACQSLRLVEQGGREALVEMRRVIGLLRRGEGVSSSGGVQASLGELDALLAGARSSGMQVALELRGHQRGLPPDLDCVAFRVVQEALTNTLKHAGPVEVSVTITFGDHGVGIDITDTGPVRESSLAGTGSGFGLTGMRERLAVHGGRLDAGPDAAGGFRVRAWLPLPETAAIA